MVSRFELKKIDEKRYELDVRGLTCPYPQLLVTRALSNLPQDSLLEVVMDNPPSVRDIPPVLEGKGYKVLDISRLDASTWRIQIRTEK